MTKMNLSFDLKNITKWTEIYLIKFEIETSIDALKKLVTLQNESFEMINNELNTNIVEVKSHNQQMDEADLDQYIAHLYGIDEEIISELKRIQNISQVISIFAVLESKLKVIRDKIQNDFKPNFELGKTNSVLLGHWKFFRLFFDYQSLKSEKYFTSIFNQMEVRNICNHQDGIATKEQYAKLSNIDGLNFREFEELFYLEGIDKIFIENLFLKTESFLGELLKELRDKTNEILK